MARKNRKKHRHKPSQQELKIKAVQYKKVYLDKIRECFKLLTGEDCLGLIPEPEIGLLYQMHFTPPRIEAAPGTKITKKLFQQFRETLDRILNHNKVKIMEGEHEITLLHYVTYYNTIHLYIAQLQEGRFNDAMIVKEKFRKYLDTYEESNTVVLKSLEGAMRLLGIMFSNPDSYYFWLEFDAISRAVEHKGSYYLMRIHSEKPEIMYFDINGESRPAYRLGGPQPEKGITWLKAKIPSMGSAEKEEELDLYIQPHAVKRIFERMEVINVPFIQFYFFVSFSQPRPFYFKGSLLFPVHFGHSLVGYFAGSIWQKKILLRTFLFLTNDGTPEAAKLQEIAGLSKIDIKYLKIDKLRTFITSDIISNEPVKKIFIEAGCESLFKLEIDEQHFYGSGKPIADEMKHYLGIDN